MTKSIVYLAILLATSATANADPLLATPSEIKVLNAQGLNKSLPTEQVRMSVRINEGSTNLVSINLVSNDKSSSQVFVGNETPYVSGVNQVPSAEKGKDILIKSTNNMRTGFDVWLAPAITADGKITLYYHVKYSELLSMNAFDPKNPAAQKPDILSQVINQKVSLIPGKELSIPIEIKTNNPLKPTTNYVFNITATKE